METTEKKVNPKRELLKQLSNQVKPLVLEGEFETVNAAIIETIYKKDGHEVFKKFSEWKEEKKNVLKGSKSFTVWAKPLKTKKEASPEEQDEYSFFPICHLFSNKQVA